MRYLLVLACATTLLCGCQQTATQEEIDALKLDRQQEVISKAREFALEHTKDLSEDKRSYIRFTEPHIYESKVLGGKRVIREIATHIRNEKTKTKTNEAFNLSQILVTWNPPGVEKSITVMGTAYPNLSDYEEVQLIRNQFYKSQSLITGAINKARNYAMQSMSYLSESQEHAVRFTNPMIRPTSFDLDFKSSEYYTKLDRRQKSNEDENKREQASIIWDVNGKSIVITGFWIFSENKHSYLRSWIPLESQLLSSNEIQ